MIHDLREEWRAEIEQLAEGICAAQREIWGMTTTDQLRQAELETGINTAANRIASKMRALKSVAEMDEIDRNKAEGGA